MQSGKDKKTRRCATETDTVICKHAYDAAYGSELRFHFSETIVLLGKHVFDIEEGAVRFISWTIMAKTLSRCRLSCWRKLVIVGLGCWDLAIVFGRGR